MEPITDSFVFREFIRRDHVEGSIDRIDFLSWIDWMSRIFSSREFIQLRLCCEFMLFSCMNGKDE